MPFALVLVQKVDATINDLAHIDKRKHKRVLKCLAYLEQDPLYPGLASHRYETMSSATGEPVWESYVENHNPSAWRVWWFYGPGDGEITVVGLGPHP